MIYFILGTRPEIIKMSPLIRIFDVEGIPFHILHTGQHYSYEMDKIFFEELRLPNPHFDLNVGSGSQGEQTSEMLTGIEKLLIQEHPNMVLIQGDTNTVLAAALTASKLRIPIGHVEAGLRSFDKNMPEEISRVLTDHLSTHCYAPTNKSKMNLEKEGITEGVFVTGNTIVDSIYQNLRIAKENRDPLKKLGLKNGEFFLVTAHRQENVDIANRMVGILEGLSELEARYEIPVIFPAHP